MKVRAIKPGYHNHALKKEGDVFELVEIKGVNHEGEKVIYSPEKQYSSKWMERLDGESKASSKSSAKKTVSKVDSEEKRSQSSDVL